MTSNLEFEKVKVNEQNVVLAYALWFFLGCFGVHRFYTGQSKGWMYIVAFIIGYASLVFLVGGVILLGIFGFWIYDGIKLNQIVKMNNLKLIEDFERAQK